MTSRIQQPEPLDLVGDPLLVSGIATGFEATAHYRVTEGHDEATGFFNVGGGTGEYAPFQLQIDVADRAFTLPRLFVEIFEISARDGSEINKVTRSVLYGPLIVPGYLGFREHVVSAGETLFEIADQHYGNGDLYHRIVTANPTEIIDPDMILAGQRLRIPIGS